MHHIFPWLCVWDVCYIIFCHLLQIYSGKTRILFSFNIVQFMMSSNSRMRFGLQIVFICLYIISSHYHHCANLSEVIELEKLPVRYILSSVWVRLSIFSLLSIIQYMGLCVLSLPVSLVMIERIYTLCYYHHQIWSMNYHPLFRVMSWNYGVRYMSLYILTMMFRDKDEND